MFEIYRDVREDPDPAAAWRRWRAARDELFAAPSAVAAAGRRRDDFTGLDYFDYDPAARVLATVEPARAGDARDRHERRGAVPLHALRHGRASSSAASTLALELYWLEGYGGGLYVPFADATSGDETYGAGRYLLDTVKGADLGVGRRPARARLQLRLQPVLLVRPALGLPAGTAGQPAGRRRPRGRARRADAYPVATARRIRSTMSVPSLSPVIDTRSSMPCMFSRSVAEAR